MRMKEWTERKRWKGFDKDDEEEEVDKDQKSTNKKNIGKDEEELGERNKKTERQQKIYTEVTRK